MPVLHIVRACACVSTLCDVGLASDQAVTISLYPSSTILMLKLVMNYFLQSFPFLLIERRTVVSHWQNPTPGPLVSIRWQQLEVISLPSPSINWEIIQMRTPGGTLIFSHIRRLGPFFGVQNSEFQYFLGVLEKGIFLGVLRFCGYFLGVITKLGEFEGHFYAI